MFDAGVSEYRVQYWDDAYRPDRGRVLTEEDLKRVPKFHRYSDEDEHYVPPRTLPGVHASGAYRHR